LSVFIQIPDKIVVHFPNKWGRRERIPWGRSSWRGSRVAVAGSLDSWWQCFFGEREEEKRKKKSSTEMV
jgi:hypothetical protein